jgi:Domain of unknown function (DUF4190)
MTSTYPATTERSAAPRQPPDALATASLICGIASFVPLAPPFITPVAAIVLGLLSGDRDTRGSAGSRSGRATAGIILGGVSLAMFAVFCIVYFGVLGYPLPHLHRYHPGG